MTGPCYCETCVNVVNMLQTAQLESQRGLDNTISLSIAITLSNTYDPQCRLPLNYWLPQDFSLPIITIIT